MTEFQEELVSFVHDGRFWISYAIMNLCFIWGAMELTFFALTKIINLCGLKKTLLQAAFEVMKRNEKE